MKQAIAGETPPESAEATVMTIWPTMSVHPAGRLLGQLCGFQGGINSFFTFGKLFALASIPVALGLFFWGLAPFVCQRFRLTNRRLLVLRGLSAVEERSVALDNFDSIDIEVLPGQEWFHAGEMIFRLGAIETFRIGGVSRPESFRHTCLEARQALVSVREVVSRQAAAV